MKLLSFALISMSAFLTSCATHTARPATPEQFLQPTVIEGAYPSLDAVIADPSTTTFDLYRFGGYSEDALLRCNADKGSALLILKKDAK